MKVTFDIQLPDGTTRAALPIRALPLVTNGFFSARDVGGLLCDPEAYPMIEEREAVSNGPRNWRSATPRGPGSSSIEDVIAQLKDEEDVAPKMRLVLAQRLNQFREPIPVLPGEHGRWAAMAEAQWKADPTALDISALPDDLFVWEDEARKLVDAVDLALQDRPSGWGRTPGYVVWSDEPRMTEAEARCVQEGLDVLAGRSTNAAATVATPKVKRDKLDAKGYQKHVQDIARQAAVDIAKEKGLVNLDAVSKKDIAARIAPTLGLPSETVMRRFRKNGC